MLVLTRKAEESIKIGSDIVIKIISVQGKRVRVAIDAPPSVPIQRAELEDKLKNSELLLGSC
ncbi:MAG: carbon storage regulator [Planctomycetaceae bacterium]|nr:carbon storage regulator [Planctomycetaceae bacterium]